MASEGPDHWESARRRRGIPLAALVTAVVVSAGVGFVGGQVVRPAPAPAPEQSRPPAPTPRPSPLPEPSLHPPVSESDQPVARRRTPCGTARIARRPYGKVIVGTTVEVRTADAGQFLVMDVMDRESPPRTLRLRAIRVHGPGRLWFDEAGELSQNVVLHEWAHRTSPGWPPHWGVAGRITGPGCWRLRVDARGTTETVPFEVTQAALRSWR